MRRLLPAIVLLLPMLLYSGQTLIYDIQFTNNSGTDGTYPSPYRNQVVTTSGIVTAIHSGSGGFYMSEPEGGPWRGIYINDRNREVQVGDNVELTGEVSEHFGFTTIRNVRNLTVISSGNQLPPATSVSTGELAVSEAYEGVLVQVTNVTIERRDEQNNVWLINDGTGISRLFDGFLSSGDRSLTMNSGQSYNRITGIIDYRFGEYRLNARKAADVDSSPLGSSKPSWGRIKSYYR